MRVKGEIKFHTLPAPEVTSQSLQAFVRVTEGTQ